MEEVDMSGAPDEGGTYDVGGCGEFKLECWGECGSKYSFDGIRQMELVIVGERMGNGGERCALENCGGFKFEDRSH